MIRIYNAQQMFFTISLEAIFKISDINVLWKTIMIPKKGRSIEMQNGKDHFSNCTLGTEMQCGPVLGRFGRYGSYPIVSIWSFQFFQVFSGSRWVSRIELDSSEATQVVWITSVVCCPLIMFPYVVLVVWADMKRLGRHKTTLNNYGNQA